MLHTGIKVNDKIVINTIHNKQHNIYKESINVSTETTLKQRKLFLSNSTFAL